MGAAGSIRGANIDGIPYNVAADADISLNNREEIESVPHSGGNMQKVTIVAGNAEAVKLIVTSAEYDTLRQQAAGLEDIPLSYTEADGSVYRTVGRVMVGARQTNESSCEVQFLTSTGNWEIFAAS